MHLNISICIHRNLQAITTYRQLNRCFDIFFSLLFNFRIWFTFNTQIHHYLLIEQIKVDFIVITELLLHQYLRVSHLAVCQILVIILQRVNIKYFGIQWKLMKVKNIFCMKWTTNCVHFNRHFYFVGNVCYIIWCFSL